MTLEEALSIAVEFQKHGALDDAEEVYRRLREVAPDHPDVLHFAGVLAHQRGRSDEAAALMQRSLAVKPDQPGCLANLGIALRARGRLDEALDAYRQSLRLEPGNADVQCNMGVLLRAQGKPEEAEVAYRTAIRLAPRHAEAYHNLGVLLAATHRVKEAVECYCKALTANPVHPDARARLAAAFCILGERGKAVELLEDWLREVPDDAVARHLLAACSGRGIPARASDAYVERTFDDFADHFELKLATLGYRAPELVLAMLEDAGVEPERRLTVLDAGCGTGLCGPLLRPYAARLVGVDLSGRMLEQARQKGLYDDLVKRELSAYLATQVAAYDLIVSADTLVYFGALDTVVRAAAGALRPGGLFVFTVEELIAQPTWTDARDGGRGGRVLPPLEAPQGAGCQTHSGGSDAAESHQLVAAVGGAAASGGHRINTHGRYSHHRDYVTEVLERAGFRPYLARAELRMEGGVPVNGLVVRAAIGQRGR